VRVLVSAAKKYADMNTTSLAPTVLAQVGHIIGVSSCKGGVGKSTVAANLALSLQARGLRVGLLDADVYGPSLPLLLPALDDAVRRSPNNPKHVLPLQARDCPDLKIFSFGHVNPSSGAPGAGGKTAAVVRGPIASRIITQLLLSTDWGDIDYLVVDMPPGTGDVQITLAQSACLAGAVIVTTPHQLSLVDAAKGVAMLDDLKVPTLAVVENMSHFLDPAGGKHYPFGRGGRRNLLRGCAELFAAPSNSGGSGGSGERKSLSSNEAFLRLRDCPLHSVPLEPAPVYGLEGEGDGEGDGDEALQHMTPDELAAAVCLQGMRDDTQLLPTVLGRPHSPAAQSYAALARDVIREIFQAQVSVLTVPSVSYQPAQRRLLLRYFSASEATEFSVPVEELRVRDPRTGRRLPDTTSAQALIKYADVSPTALDHKGQYGVAVVWSDGHYADIFPYDVLRDIAEDLASGR